jgi:type VII secretion integral membrane protein EccD
MLPTIVRHAGEDLDEAGTEHGGWVLQRLGEQPLDEEATPNTAEVRDGETLYLRAHRETLPVVHFDDLVDAVTATMRERPGSWQPSHSRNLLLVLAAIAATVSAVLLGLPGPGPVRAVSAGVAGLLLLVGASLASRAGGNMPAGVLLGLAGVGHVALAGFLLVDGGWGDDRLGARLLAGAALAGAASMLALAGVGSPVFLGSALASLLASIGAAASAYGMPLARAAGLVAVLTVVVAIPVPALAFRLSGLRLPPLPANAEQLQEGIEPYPGNLVVAGSAVADGYMAALYASAGLLCLLCLTVLAGGAGGASLVLASVLSLLLLVHARAMGARWHRLAALVPGAYGVTLVGLRLGVGFVGPERLALVAGVLVVAGGLTATALTVPGRRLLPYWGRAADILHSLLAAALIPLLLLDLGVYHVLRGLFG